MLSENGFLAEKIICGVRQMPFQSGERLIGQLDWTALNANIDHRYLMISIQGGKREVDASGPRADDEKFSLNSPLALAGGAIQGKEMGGQEQCCTDHKGQGELSAL
jgi:hypothetical protein